MTIPQDLQNVPLPISLTPIQCNIIGQALNTFKNTVPIDQVAPVVDTFLYLKNQVAMAEEARNAKLKAEEAEAKAAAAAPIVPAPTPAPAPTVVTAA